jgi:1,4-alpha-glucan branching enzyme
MVVNPNYNFTITGFENANSVAITGSFLNWNETGLSMYKKDNTWILPFYLPQGKITYKYIVDGQWMIDPGNPQYEENEFNTGNSVLWIE